MPTQREVDEATIRRQVDKIVEGIRTKDLEGLKQLYATDVVSFDVEPPLQHVGVEAKLKNWAKVFTFFQDVTYEVRDLTLTVGDEVAYGHCFRPAQRHAEERDGDERHVGPRHFLLPEDRRQLADRARPGFCAVRCGERQGSDRPRALTSRKSPARRGRYWPLSH